MASHLSSLIFVNWLLLFFLFVVTGGVGGTTVALTLTAAIKKAKTHAVMGLGWRLMRGEEGERRVDMMAKNEWVGWGVMVVG
jgi:hypothetical protein